MKKKNSTDLNKKKTLSATLREILHFSVKLTALV